MKSNWKVQVVPVGTLRSNKRWTWKIATIRRPLCLLVALVLASACGSSHHQAYTQSGDFDRGLMARAAEFVSALNAKDAAQLDGLVFPDQKNEVPAFLAAYGGRSAVILNFDHTDGPNTEGTAEIQITCSASRNIVLPQVFSWKKDNWRTYIYLPGQKVGVTDQQCS